MTYGNRSRTLDRVNSTQPYRMTAWQRERRDGPIQPMPQPSWWQRFRGKA